MTRPTLSRRQALQSAATFASAAAAMSVARSAHAAGGDTIKIGMIGCGGRCSGAALEAMTGDPGAKLVAMCDLFADRIEAKRKSLAGNEKIKGQVAVADDHMFVGLDGYKKVIDAVDVVLIACAAKFHPMYVKAAIDAGKHAFCEKPHGIDPYGIRVLASACETARQKKLGVLSGLQSRFHLSIKETIQRIHDGQIGDIVAIQETWQRGPYGSVSRPKGLRELEVQYGNQYRFSWLCGDDVTQTLVHNIDRATWAMKEATPVKCTGTGGRSSSQGLLGDVFDHHSAVYQYANGVRLYAICRTTNNCYNENSSVIMGTKGTAYPMNGQITGETPWKYSGKGESPYLREQAEFFKSIRAGEPINCGDYMCRSTLVCIMGQLSCYSGQEIKWDKLAQSNYYIPPRPEECTWEMNPPTAPDEAGVYPVCATPGVTKNV